MFDKTMFTSQHVVCSVRVFFCLFVLNRACKLERMFLLARLLPAGMYIFAAPLIIEQYTRSMQKICAASFVIALPCKSGLFSTGMVQDLFCQLRLAILRCKFRLAGFYPKP